MTKAKIIRDPIHGNITFKDLFIELLDTPEIQRLYNIKQLGFAHLVFPGAHHTRLEHSLGAYRITEDIAIALDLPENQKILVQCAALLHDIGHGPFSHTLESILLQEFGVDHVDLTEKLLFGDYEIYSQGEQSIVNSPCIHEVLHQHSLDIKRIVEIIRGDLHQQPFLSQLLHSAIDVDQLDYLMRDAYYTGVSYGIIDLQRLLQTITIHDEKLAVDRKGVSVVENILMARGLMYSSVYFHKTVRIAELMLSKALELLPDPEPFEFYTMTDGEFLQKLKTMGSYQYEIATLLKYRRLFKQAYVIPFSDITEDNIQSMKALECGLVRKEKEQLLQDYCGIPEGHVIIDVPFYELQRAEPRIYKTDIDVVDKTGVKSMDEFTPIAEAIRSRATPDWAIMIATDKKYVNTVAQHAQKIIEQ